MLGVLDSGVTVATYAAPQSFNIFTAKEASAKSSLSLTSAKFALCGHRRNAKSNASASAFDGVTES